MSVHRFGTAIRSAAGALALALAISATPARAGESSTAQPVDADAGMGIAAGLASLVYTPAKVLYALGGGVAAGMAYLASAGNQDVTTPILTPSVRGDYVVTPEHLRGERTLEFFGREPAATHHVSASTPPVSSGDGLDAAQNSHSAAPEGADGEGASE